MVVRRLTNDTLYHSAMPVYRINDDELYHHGVKGQRWGHRKQRVLVGRSRRGRQLQNTTNSSNNQVTKKKMRNKLDKPQKLLLGLATAGVAASAALYGRDYIKKHSSKINKKSINSSDAKLKFKVAEEWADRVMNGEKLNYKDFADNRFREMRNFAGNFRASYRKNRYRLPG